MNYISTRGEKKKLNFSDVCILIDKVIANASISNLKDKVITLSGGEPFIREDIFEIID